MLGRRGTAIDQPIPEIGQLVLLRGRTFITQEVIDEALASDPERLPSHVAQRVDERVERALRTDAILGRDAFETLSGRLEYFDLRELQDTSGNKGLWE